MGDIVKLALRLFIFALVASVLLAVTNEVTKGPIEQQKLASKMAALNTVLPGCEYEQIEYEGISDDSALDEIFIGKNADGSIKGYALTASPQGYGGEIPITLGVSEGGYVTQVYVGSLQETQGLGSRVGDDAFKEQFIAIAADPDTLRNDVDTIAGATISSSAFVNAVQEMLTYTKGTLGIEPHAGDKDAILAEAAAINGGDEGEDAPVETTTNTYDVTGFAAFKVDVTVDSNGKIVSVSVPENNETPGLGADLIADQSVFDALVGQDIATAQIDVKSGVTLTSNAINDALKQAAADLGGAEAAPAAAGDPYTVKGMNKFTLYVEVKDGGKIASVSAPNNSETPGFGADMLTDEALSALVGEDLATAHVDVKSGVTLTSDAINAALKQAAIANGVAVAAEPTVEATAEPTAEPTAESAAVPTVAENAAVDLTMYDVTGFAPFKVGIAVDENGKIVSVSVPENSETPGLGADLIADQSIFDALVGQDIATAQIDVKSGVTLTSDAINAALKQAAIANGVTVVAEPTVEATAEPAAEPQPETVMEQPAAPEPVVEPAPQETPQREPATPEPVAETAPLYKFAVRTNVLYDAFLLPTLGVEWRVNRDLGVKLDGSLSWWGGEHGKVQKMWMLSPEVRWYLLRDKRFYVGLSGNYGEYNLYKYALGGLLSKDTGYQGSLWNAGAVVGYQLRLSRSFSVDFNLGLGYARYEYDNFGVTDGVRVYKERGKLKNFWGPTQAGISLVWTIGGNK